MLQVCSIFQLLQIYNYYIAENVFKAHLLRAKDNVLSFKRKYTEPSSQLLLPQPLPHPYQRPYTLLIELKDILIHSDFDVWKGNRVKHHFFFSFFMLEKNGMEASEEAWTGCFPECSV